MAPPTVSIVICTRNRAASLAQTLVSLGRCEVPTGYPSEFIVVDNGSTDETAQVVRAAVMENGLTWQYVVETAPGLSRARNAGLRASRGKIILFTDDDVRVPARWIAGMCAPILAGEADAVAGGVHFPAAYEPQLTREPFKSRRGWLASTEGTDPHTPGCLVGANMAITRQAVELLGGFDPELGAGALGFCEESLFAFRLLDAGLRIRTAFDFSVEHHFDLGRLTPATLADMAERLARSAAYVDYHWEHKDIRAAQAEVRRAAALLLLERLRAPWRVMTRGSTLPLTQRRLTLAYWRKLAELTGQPQRYQRKGLGEYRC